MVSGARLPFESQPKPADLSEESTDESDLEDGSKPKEELVTRLSSIVDCLNSLYRLSYKIRNPNLRPSTTKAILLKRIDLETGVDVFERYAELDASHVTELFTLLRQGRGVSKDSNAYLLPRLSSSINLRRRYFKYWQKHSKKLTEGIQIGEIIPGIPGLNLANMNIHSDHQDKGAPVSAKDKKMAYPLQPATILSKTDATPYDSQLDDKTERETAYSITSTAIDVDRKGIDVPGPPAQAMRGEDFTCPYCYVLCPAKQGRGRAWKQHVLHDLQPYVCTYEHCSKANELFRSRSLWMRHKDSAHRRYWRCYDHPSVTYTTYSELRHYLSNQHSETFSDTQIKNLTDVYAFVSNDNRECCPICLQSQPFERGIANHVANHLERIALFSLAKSYQDDEANGNSEEINSNKIDDRESFSTEQHLGVSDAESLISTGAMADSLPEQLIPPKTEDIYEEH